MDKRVTEILLEKECNDMAEFIRSARSFSKTHSPARRLWVGRTDKWFTVISAPAEWQPPAKTPGRYTPVAEWLAIAHLTVVREL